MPPQDALVQSNKAGGGLILERMAFPGREAHEEEPISEEQMVKILREADSAIRWIIETPTANA